MNYTGQYIACDHTLECFKQLQAEILCNALLAWVSSTTSSSTIEQHVVMQSEPCYTMAYCRTRDSRQGVARSEMAFCAKHICLHAPYL